MFGVICAFALGVRGLSFRCDYQMRAWKVAGSAYTCYNPVVTTSDGNFTHVQSVTGNHLEGKRNADVIGFSLYHDQQQLLTRLPKGIEKFFPNLVAFVWQDGNLRTMSSDDFKPFPNLLVTSFKSNKLTVLDGTLFVHTPMLAIMSFDDNLLQNVGYGFLDGFKTLTTAYLSGNPCINLNATTPQAIQQLKIELLNQCPPLITTTQSTTSATTSTKTSSRTTNSPYSTVYSCADELKLIISLRERILDLEKTVEYCVVQT